MHTTASSLSGFMDSQLPATVWQPKQTNSPPLLRHRERLVCASRKPDLSERMGIIPSFIILSPDAHFSCDTPCHSVCDPAFARCAGVGELGPPAPNRRASALRKKALQVDSTGPSIVGLAVAHLERLALGAGHRSTRDGHCLASQEVPSLLGVEDSAGPAGKTHASPRGPRPDPQDVPRKPHLGCTPHPW